MDFFSGLMKDPNGTPSGIINAFLLMRALLDWDVVRGALAFLMAIGIALFAVDRLRRALESR